MCIVGFYMANNVNLTTSMNSNLLALQKTQRLMDNTQLRLSTGLKVNSAIDDPSSYYTAISLNSRANDLSALWEAMGQALQTIQAANEAMESLTQFLTQGSAVATQAIVAAAEAGAIERHIDTTTDLTTSKTTEDFIAEGYTAVATEEELRAAIEDNEKIVL